MGQDPHVKKGIDTMTNHYLESAPSLSNLTHRMEVLTKLCNLTPGTEFYASDLGLSGQDMNALRMNGVIHAVPKGREEFICIDEDEELYKKVYVHCWVVFNPNLRVDFAKFCGEMATLYSAQLMML